MTSRAKSAAKITIPVVVIGTITSLLIWMGTLALANESRITKCETVDEVMLEMRSDIKEIKSTQVRMMLKIQHLQDTKMDE